MNVGEKMKKVDNETLGDTGVKLQDAIKFTLEHPTKAQRGCGGIALLLL